MTRWWWWYDRYVTEEELPRGREGERGPLQPDPAGNGRTAATKPALVAPTSELQIQMQIQRRIQIQIKNTT